MAQSLSSADHPLSNSAARADLIREAVRVLAEKEREVQALNAEIREYKQKHIKGDLGFKLADWHAVYRVCQADAEDRDTLLLATVRECFAALGIGGSVDWVAAAERTPRGGSGNGNGFAEPNEAARLDGHHDGLGGVQSYAEHWPPGEPGHGDYMLGLAEGEAERDRVMAMGNGADHEAPPKRGRGRPRKQQEETAASSDNSNSIIHGSMC